MCSKYIQNSYILHSGIRSDLKGIKIILVAQKVREGGVEKKKAKKKNKKKKISTARFSELKSDRSKRYFGTQALGQKLQTFKYPLLQC